MQNQPNRMVPVLYGTFVMTMIAVLPLVNFINLFFCAGIILGGIAGVFSYNRQIAGTDIPLTSKDGVMIGILSGILAGIFVSLINFLFMLMSKHNPVDEALKLMNDFALPPEVTVQMNKFSDEFNKYGFSPTISIVSLFSNLVIYPLFGMLGAILGVSIIKKRNKKNIL
ncbi:MAG: hypothetical protein HY959_13445 [Ignavibacteriae bacterium]|nr:hypothetical protein [Ignavibacteriota bacterium]